MLNIIEGGFYSTAHKKLCDEILSLTAKGIEAFLIVPEQQTVMAEGEMAALLPPQAPLTFEATNFTRFANTAFRRLGGLNENYCDNATRALVMWKTLTELAPFLSITEGKRIITDGIVEKALRAVAEMQSVAITPDELAELSENKNLNLNKRLLSKLSDLSKIMQLYKKLLSEKYSDAYDDLGYLTKKLEMHPDSFRGASFFIEGFTSFTEPQYSLLSALIERASVTVLLPVSKHNREGFEYTEINNTKERLTRLADKLGAKKTVEKIGELGENESELLSSICDLLWHTKGNIDNKYIQNAEILRIFRAQNTYEECDFVAADIKRRVMQGESYRSFAIVANDADKYVGIIDKALQKAKIPCFISKSRSVSSFEAVKLIYAAFEAISNGFARKDVIAYMKCGFCGIERKAIDEFELYTEKWQISGARFLDMIPWNMSPDGISARKSSDVAERLMSLNNTRDAVIRPLSTFADDLREARTVTQFSKSLINFLCAIDLPGGIAKKCRELQAIGENEAATENERMWEIICTSLDTLVYTLGESEIDIQGFVSQLNVVTKSISVGRIPARFDVVTVGSADMLRLSDKKHVYLIGVNRGEFPANPKESSYFSERERLSLSKTGITLLQDSETGCARELFCFSRAFAAGKSTVTLISADRGPGFDAAMPSDVIRRITDITCGAVKEVYISSLKSDERIYCPDTALGEMRKMDGEGQIATEDALRAAGYAPILEISKRNIANENLVIGNEVKGLIYGSDIYTSQSKIDRYVSCPFSYFLQYDLALSEDEKAEFNPRNIGTFIHSLLESFFVALKESKKTVDSLSSEEKKELVKRAAEEYIFHIYEGNNIKTKRTDILLSRLCRAAMPVVEGLCREFEGCKYTPSFFELKIGNDEGVPAPAHFVTDDKKNIYIGGYIDRVDTYKCGDKVYVRVVDYKTGTKKFSPGDLEEGKNLQMFLYLQAIVQSGKKEFLKKLGVSDNSEILPGGVIYTMTDIGDLYINEDSEEAGFAAAMEKQSRQGMLLCDEENLDAMNPEHLPLKRLKNGEWSEGSKKLLYTKDGWKDITESISEKVCEIVGNMKNGEIPLTSETKKPPCSYCKFKMICRSPRG